MFVTINMKISHFVSSIDLSSGGPARSVTHLIEAILDQSKKVSVVLETLKSQDPILSSFTNKNAIINFNKSGFLGYSKELKAILKKSNSDLYHGHGLWEVSVHQMVKEAIEKNTPYILTPRGMLEPWSLEQGKLKKQLALKLFQYKDLAKASCIHATAPMEVESIRTLGLKNPIAMIPNGVQIDEFPSILPEKSTQKKKILFLSRIHVKKGIENLIEAWSLIDEKNRSDWKIEIVGNGDDVYIQTLKEEINFKKLSSQIEIKKPVFGEEKIKLFREASLFVLPTFSENFGIVIAEALASYTPVITTKGTPWEDLNDFNCGWWIEIGVKSLKETIEQAINLNENKLLEMGVNGRKLIEDKYSMDSVGKQMLELYEWVLSNKKDNKPKFVYL